MDYYRKHRGSIACATQAKEKNSLRRIRKALLRGSGRFLPGKRGNLAVYQSVLHCQPHLPPLLERLHDLRQE